MTQEQFVSRKERAERDVFVITAAEEGWRVRSAHNPSKYYLVSANGTELQCACPDFQAHATEDPTWRCKHVLAVQDHQAKTGAADPQTECELAEERAAVQTEGSVEVVQRPNGEPSAAQMLIKRSISPDGRIDSISIEFTLPLSEATVSQIRDRAAKTLKLQTEIVKSFLNGAGRKVNSDKPVPDPQTKRRYVCPVARRGRYERAVRRAVLLERRSQRSPGSLLWDCRSNCQSSFDGW